jgi:hypothetical protein
MDEETVDVFLVVIDPEPDTESIAPMVGDHVPVV